MKKNMVKSLLLLSFLLVGCNEDTNSKFTPKQVQEAKDFCEKDNTVLALQIAEGTDKTKYVVGLACKDQQNNVLYKLALKYPKVETMDCGRGIRPCIKTDYSNPIGIGYTVDD